MRAARAAMDTLMLLLTIPRATSALYALVALFMVGVSLNDPWWRVQAAIGVIVFLSSSAAFLAIASQARRRADAAAVLSPRA